MTTRYCVADQVGAGSHAARQRLVPSAGRRAAALLAFALCAPPALAAQVEVRGATITELQDAMAAGRTTSVEITEAYLARIAAYDRHGPALNAMVWMNPRAVAHARILDRERAEGRVRGPLHGIPVILKDNYDTSDLPSSAGTLALATHVAPDDAFQVAKLRAAGVVVLGKSNMHELAAGITTIGSVGGQTRNPYDPRRNPGGSSGGTGAAIAASFAAVGWGSDTCGSIRIPAAQNDLVGLRPTKGLSSIDGIVPLSHTQDVAGPLARTVRDLAIALDATIGPDPADAATEILEDRTLPRFVEALDAEALEGARLGVLNALFGDAPEEGESARIVRRALARMVELGADTVSVEIPGYDTLVAGSGLIPHEFKWDLMEYLAASPNAPVRSLDDVLGSGLVHRAMFGRLQSLNESEEREGEAHRSAFAKRAPLRAAIEATLDRHDLDALVFPTVRTIPAVIGDPQRGSSCSLSAHSGVPALSVPAGFTQSGLPIGMELVGRTFDDARLVSLAYAFEQATDHRREPESVPPLVAGAAPPPVTIPVAASGRDFDPPRAGTARVTGSVTLESARGALVYDLEVSGVVVSEVLAVVLQAEGEEGDRMVLARLSGPGVTRAQGELRLDAGLRERAEAGDLAVVLATVAHPFGAARAALPFDR